MYRIAPTATLLLLLVPAAFSQSPSLTGEAKAAWTQISTNIVKAAEKLPDSDYSFRPTADVRTFAQLIGHLTDANYLFCSPFQSEAKSPMGAEKKLSTKAELVPALKESVAYCNSATERLSDAQAAEAVKFFGRERAKLSILHMNVAHANEHYGNLVTYLRIKGIVPPSSEPRPSAASARLHYDLAHGQVPSPPQFAEISKRVGFEVAASDQPLTPETIKGARVLYLRAPSKEITPSEKEAIVSYVNGGGSLLLVVDEERRQSLATTGINDIIAPFGMKLTPDTPYVHNCGAIAKAGEINRADREIPYSGGRAVEGGTPFAYQIDKEGRPAQPFAAWKKVDGGGRVVVMGEAMATIFLGTADAQRLAGVPRDPGKTVYWGKDSVVFMEEVLAWLMKK